MRESSKLPARRYVRASYAVVCLVVLAVFVLAMAGRMGALAEGAYSIPETHVSDISRTDPAAAPPAPVALIVKQVAPRDALRINSEIPITGGPNPAAAPFSMGRASKAVREDALDCLTAAIYYEAARESPDGQRAVAQVVLNRVRHPAFPASVCGVVYQGSTLPTGCQFTFTCDGSLLRPAERSYWQRAKAIAEAALNGAVFAPVGMATHYHADYVVPVWAPNLVKNAAIGAHLLSLEGQLGNASRLHAALFGSRSRHGSVEAHGACGFRGAASACGGDRDRDLARRHDECDRRAAACRR